MCVATLCETAAAIICTVAVTVQMLPCYHCCDVKVIVTVYNYCHHYLLLQSINIAAVVCMCLSLYVMLLLLHVNVSVTVCKC